MTLEGTSHGALEQVRGDAHPQVRQTQPTRTCFCDLAAGLSGLKPGGHFHSWLLAGKEDRVVCF